MWDPHIWEALFTVLRTNVGKGRASSVWRFSSCRTQSLSWLTAGHRLIQAVDHIPLSVPHQVKETGFYSISHHPMEEPQKRQPLLGISHHAVHIYSTLLTARQHIIIPLDSKPLTSKTHGNVTGKEHSSLMPRLLIFHPKVGYSRSTSTQVLTLVTFQRTINLHLRIEDLLFHQLTAEHTPVNWSDLENLQCLVHVQYKSRWKDLGSVW